MFTFIDTALSHLTSLGGRAHPELRLFLRYSVGGGLAAVADLLIVSGLVEFAHVGPLPAGAVSLAAGIVINFCVARYWAFRSTDPFLKQFTAFVGVALAGAGINYGSYALMVGVFHWWYFVARAFAILIAWAWNYRMNRKVTFKTIARH